MKIYNPQHFDLGDLTTLSRQEIPRQDWDSFVDESSKAWFFHLFDMQDALATWPGRNDLSFVVVDTKKPNFILAIVPLVKIEAKILGILDWNVIESRGGPILKNNLVESNKQQLLDFINENLSKIGKTEKAFEVRFSTDGLAPFLAEENQSHDNQLINMGCEISVYQTWMLDLRIGKEFVWENMEKRARNAVRKAEKSGVVIRLADRPDDLDKYYDLHCQTYHRTGVNPHPRAYFENIWNKFLPTGRAVVFFAEYNNTVVAAENFGVYKNASVYWTGAANTEGLTVQANSLVQWTAIQWMINHNIYWHEIGEAFPQLKEGKRKGLNDFKKSFGGELVPFYRGKFLLRNRYYHFIKFLRSLK
jgi:lipid II:glycine glycyltransferase (peptidoglycan interpeptide bridge formation enzyme)